MTVCAVCGREFMPGDTITSDYSDAIVHFACGPDAQDGPHVDELRERDERGLERDAERLRDEIEADA